MRKLLFLMLLGLAACGDACETTSESTGSTTEPATSTAPPPGASGRMKPKIDLRALTQPEAEGGAPAPSAVP
jgi:hypothetical protein